MGSLSDAACGALSSLVGLCPGLVGPCPGLFDGLGGVRVVNPALTA